MPSKSHLQQHMHRVLVASIEMLFSYKQNVAISVVNHKWRNPKYVGEIDGKALTWQGWSANLNKMGNPHRGILYIDAVKNKLTTEAATKFWRADFTLSTSDMRGFVVMYVENLNRLMQIC